MTKARTRENRRSERIAVSQGMWVAWRASGPRSVSRVRDLSEGGVFIFTDLRTPVGTAVELLFALPEGETRIHGIVRYADTNKGIGVEFKRMGSGDRARLQELLRRLKR
ncbi:MAG TPA: PilZ domain-containing protein [Candidatus Acidoferrales bacterium]|nr:PilZ domain-containing protein [Candidatus Acidoferrales bacterium]